MSAGGTQIKTATNIRCPNCLRKLCKIRTYNDIKFIEVKHKGAFVLATTAVIGCIDCKKTFRINTNSDLLEEIDIG